MKRRDEEYCKDQFTNFLTTTYDAGKINWKEVDQKDEPPDYFVQIAGHTYAVEVTSLTDMIVVASKPRSVTEVNASLAQVVEDAERIALQQNVLSGAYVVTSTPLSDFGRRRQSLIKQIVDFVRNTFQEESVPDTKIINTPSERFSIAKAHNESNYIGAAILFEAKWEAEAKEELSRMLQKVLHGKTHKLRNVAEDKILLVLDTFHYVDLDAWQEAILALDAVTSFHTICRIADNEGVHILFSKSSLFTT